MSLRGRHMKPRLLVYMGITLMCCLLLGGCYNLEQGPNTGTPKTYTVRQGDTLWRIAQRFGTPVETLKALNTKTEELYVGQGLRLPDDAVDHYRFVFAPWEMDLFARLVHAEAEGEPFEGKVAVAATVLNRLADPRYPDTIYGVIYQVADGAYQYSPVKDGRIDLPADEDSVNAAYEALCGRDPSLGANGFYNPKKTSNQWVRQQPVTIVLGDHVFFRY